MNKAKDTKTVIVTGDVTIDWNIARMRRTEGLAQAWNAEDLTAAFCQHGGAVMLADLVAAVAGELSQKGQAHFEVRRVSPPREKITPSDPYFPHSYAMWKPFKQDENKPESKDVWRVQEFLGLNPAHADAGLTDTWKKVADDHGAPELIVISDANLGFRQHPELWPAAIKNNNAKPWILVNTARPVAQGDLWEFLYRSQCDRLIAVMTANDLRSEQVQISRNLSWERTGQDVVRELLYNPSINNLAQCAHVVVSFGTAGVLLFSRNSETAPGATLFFDPMALEGEWGRQYRGSVIGYTSCLIGGIARDLMANACKPDITDDILSEINAMPFLHHGIHSGINAMRFLHIEGYGQVNTDPKEIKLAFPAEEVAAKLAEIIKEDRKGITAARVLNPVGEPSAEVTTTEPARKSRFWTILGDKPLQSLENVSERIVLEGLESTLLGVPIDKFGKLMTVDRREIEALHSISGLIREYASRKQKAPFSIAVFGPPGSGKSFSVTEVAESVLQEEIKRINFNLSQFIGPEDLFDAFHQVRDIALSGKIPLVFWDEFDTQLQNQPLGWLRYFLVPMQDGEFQEGQITHPIGRSIFVFAGGTSYRMETFGDNIKEEERRAVKLPDFISRLKGFLNILGPNPQDSGNTPGHDGDPYYIIRRAILLRSTLERWAPQILHNHGNKKVVNIDQGVLRAFLLTKEYRHGARSMEAIVAMSQLAGKLRFERSSLPAEAQLNLHVDGRDFCSIIQGIEVDKDMLELLAEKFHEIFCDALKAKRYKYGPVTNKKKRVHSSLRPYTELPEDEKEQNRGNVRDIPQKLASMGYKIVPVRGAGNPDEFTNEEVEKLAEEEHERWMKQKLAADWKYAKRTNKARRQHKDLLPWGELPESEREKDRALVRGIPKVLARAGYSMGKGSKKPL